MTRALDEDAYEFYCSLTERAKERIHHQWHRKTKWHYTRSDLVEIADPTEVVRRRREVLSRFIEEFNGLVARTEDHVRHSKDESIAAQASFHEEAKQLDSLINETAKRASDYFSRELPDRVSMFQSCASERVQVEQVKCYRERLIKILESL